MILAFCCDQQAGDKSLAGVIAHEIAHSWTGNLVTNKNFEHFWLNEGFTVFVERKILGLMQEGEATRSFEAIEGWKDLHEEVKNLLFLDQLYCILEKYRNDL